VSHACHVIFHRSKAPPQVTRRLMLNRLGGHAIVPPATLACRHAPSGSSPKAPSSRTKRPTQPTKQSRRASSASTASSCSRPAPAAVQSLQTHAGSLDDGARAHLLRYVLRPPLSQERLIVLSGHRGRLTLKRPWSEATSATLVSCVDATLPCWSPPQICPSDRSLSLHFTQETQSQGRFFGSAPRADRPTMEQVP